MWGRNVNTHFGVRAKAAVDMGASLAASDIPVLLEFLKDLYAVRDIDAFRRYLICNVSKLVPSEITTYNEVNCAKQQNAVMGAEPPDALEFPDSHRIFNQHIPQHPLIGHYARTGDRRALKISDFLTLRKFHSSGLYADFYRRVGVEHQVAFILPAAQPLMIGIALNRSRPDFSERDRLLLNLVRPHLIQAYRNAEAVTQMSRQSRLALQGLQQFNRVTIFLTKEGRVSHMMRQAPQLLTKYFADSSCATPAIPEILQRWVRCQVDNLTGTGVPYVRTPLVVDQEKSRLEVRLVSDGESSLLILEERPKTIEPPLFQSFGLTRRETEVLGWVVQGKTNADVASILAISPRTVQKHLERIYQKLGVESRTAAASRAFAEANVG